MTAPHPPWHERFETAAAAVARFGLSAAEAALAYYVAGRDGPGGGGCLASNARLKSECGIRNAHTARATRLRLDELGICRLEEPAGQPPILYLLPRSNWDDDPSQKPLGSPKLARVAKIGKGTLAKNGYPQLHSNDTPPTTNWRSSGRSRAHEGRNSGGGGSESAQERDAPADVSAIPDAERQHVAWPAFVRYAATLQHRANPNAVANAWRTFKANPANAVPMTPICIADGCTTPSLGAYYPYCFAHRYLNPHHTPDKITNEDVLVAHYDDRSIRHLSKERQNALLAKTPKADLDATYHRLKQQQNQAPTPEMPPEAP